LPKPFRHWKNTKKLAPDSPTGTTNWRWRTNGAGRKDDANREAAFNSGKRPKTSNRLSGVSSEGLERQQPHP